MTDINVPDKVVKTIILKAPQSRVWSAISRAEAFGAWFGAAFDGPFVPNTKLSGKIVPTQVDPEVAKHQEPHTGKKFDITIDRIEPERLLSFRWHPYEIDPNVESSHEPTTLVTFELAAVEGGTRLTITESGFDKIPLRRRAEAFKANEGGWEHQTKLVEKYLAHHDVCTSS
jgi:uncharacterized protein YndB with AHSA1/START domain